MAVTMQRAGKDGSALCPAARKGREEKSSWGDREARSCPGVGGGVEGGGGRGGGKAARTLGLLLGDGLCEMAVKITDFYCAVFMPRYSSDHFASH